MNTRDDHGATVLIKTEQNVPQSTFNINTVTKIHKVLNLQVDLQSCTRKPSLVVPLQVFPACSFVTLLLERGADVNAKDSRK